MSSEVQEYELELGEDIEALGLRLTKMRVVDNYLFPHNGEGVIKVRYTNNCKTTASDAKQALSNTGHFNDRSDKLEEFDIKWQRETEILSRIIKLEHQELGGNPPSVNDLLEAGLTHEEIDSV